MRVLLCLVDCAPQPASCTDLLTRGWPNVVVGDNAVHSAISRLRRALGDTSPNRAYVETIPKLGYRLIAPVTALADAPQRCRQVQPFDVQPGIAILPFDNVGQPPQGSALALGLTVDLHVALRALRRLRVAPLRMARDEAARCADAREVAQRLRVRYLLTGTVQYTPRRLHVAAELADVEAGATVWAETYDRPLVDVVDLQADIACAVAARAGLEVNRAESARLCARPVGDLHAFELIGRAVNQFWNLSGSKASPEDTRQALELARLAARSTPAYQPAAAYLSAMLYKHALQRAPDNLDECVDEAVTMAQQAVALRPDDAEVLYCAGWVLAHHPPEREHGLATMLRAHQFSPSDSWGEARLAIVMAQAGRTAEALGIAERQLDMNLGLDGWNQFTRMVVDTRDGNHQRVSDTARAFLANHPYNTWFWLPLANAAGAMGDTATARDAVARAAGVSPNFTPEHWAHVMTRHVWDQPGQFYVGLEHAGLL